MDIIYYFVGLIAVLLVIWYVWKKIPTKSIEEGDQSNLAPYKVEKPVVATNITDVIPSIETAVPELKVVNGSSASRKTVKKVQAKKPVAKKPAANSVAKPAAKPRAKKPTDTV
jgi:hypothetical protein